SHTFDGTPPQSALARVYPQRNSHVGELHSVPERAVEVKLAGSESQTTIVQAREMDDARDTSEWHTQFKVVLLANQREIPLAVYLSRTMSRLRESHLTVVQMEHPLGLKGVDYLFHRIRNGI